MASWEEGDPIKSVAAQNSPTKQWETGSTDNEPMPSLANLETRKKRRESTHHSETKSFKPNNVLPLQALDSKESIPQPFKAGAKRKLNVRDDDGDTEIRTPLDNDDFIFNRKAETKVNIANQVTDAVAEKLTGLNMSQDSAAKRMENPAKVQQIISTASQKPRKALGASKLLTSVMNGFNELTSIQKA